MSMAEAQDGAALRRVRSVGDLPRRPERAQFHSSLRASTSGPYDFDINEVPRIRSMLSSAPPSCPPLQLETNANRNPSPPTLSTQASTPDRQAPQDPPPQPQNMPLYVRVLTYFGLGRRATRARKSLVSLIWSLTWGFVQFVVVTTMLILTGTHFRSRSDPKLSEWTACERPLGVWASIWIIRCFLVTGLACWDFRRDRILHPPPADTEAGITGATDPISGQNGPTDAAVINTAPTNAAPTPPEVPTLPRNLLYSRLTFLSSLMTLSWFLTAHILEYTSTNTCRHSSPHLWWLVFGILCTLYLTVLEVILLGFIVFVLAPILFIFWNIFLICIGRHPLQHPNMINPEIGKLPKTVVERIPLVLYIPPPPEGIKTTLVGEPHSYPPKSVPVKTHSKPRFRLLRVFRKKKDSSTSQPISDEKNDESIEGPDSWEAHWELGEYPSVTLEGNRAACAICLMDFEEPKRKETPGEGSSNTTGREMINSIAEENQEKNEVGDAEDGVQPLRLLACSHVFHKTCLDPWLTDVSGRCPICQRAVEIPKSSKKKKPYTSTRNR